MLHYSQTEAINEHLNNGFEIVQGNAAQASKDHKTGKFQGASDSPVFHAVTSDSAVMNRVASNEGTTDKTPAKYSPVGHETGRFSQPNEKTNLERASRDLETGEFLQVSDGSVKDSSGDATKDSIERLLQKKSDELRVPPIPLFYKGDR